MEDYFRSEEQWESLNRLKLKDFIPKYPDISTFEGRSKWALQVSGGLLSNSFGKKTDNYLLIHM